MKIIGIDLGTTNSVMAVVVGRKPVVIPNAEGERVTASVVTFDLNRGRLMVGTPAWRQAVTNAQNTVFSTKRFVGRRFGDPIIQRDLKLAPYQTRADKMGGVSIWMGTRWYSPPEILAMILGKLKQEAEAYLGEPVTHAVITVPAYFNNLQRQAVRDASGLAGLVVERIINEPTAACLAYGLHKGGERKIAVYHLGGGTLDVSILDMGEGIHKGHPFYSFEVIATNGHTHLGGDDFDYQVIDWVCDKFLKEQGVDLRQDGVALQRLKWAVEKAKCELSTVHQTDINLPYIIADVSGTHHLLMTLTRAKLEELVSDLIERTLVPCNQALADARLAATDIDEVVLVGQQTRMPAVQEAVRKFFGKDPHRGVDPAEVVALGAAIQASILEGKIKDTTLLDVTPFSLSIETLGGIATRLIERNRTIPTRENKICTTAADDQTSVDIKVYQGERAIASDNLLLGQFRLEGIPPSPREVPQIEVTFDIDANGILSVSAEDKGTGRQTGVTIIAPGDVVSGVPWKKTKKLLEDAKACKDAEAMIVNVEKRLSEQGDRLPTQARNVTDSKVLALRTALEGKEVVEIQRRTKELDVVLRCIEALGDSRNEKAVELLVELLMKEEDKQVREDIRQTLRHIGGAKVDEVLRPRTWIDKLLGHRRWADR